MTDPAADRTVHVRLDNGIEIVRYDRAGKWYEESSWHRKQISVTTAARTALLPGALVFCDLPGGQSFDAKVRRLRAR